MYNIDLILGCLHKQCSFDDIVWALGTIQETRHKSTRGLTSTGGLLLQVKELLLVISK